MNTPLSFPQEQLWLVDGFNYLHAVVLGSKKVERWWGEEHRERVVADLKNIIKRGRSFEKKQVRILFDGDSESKEPLECGSSVVVEFHADADASIVEACVRARLTGISTLVVSADRSLGDRCRATGARVLKPWQLPEPRPSV